LYDCTGVATLSIAQAGNEGLSTLGDPTNTHNCFAQSDTVFVPTFSLAAILENRNISYTDIDMIKLDVEGAELHVLLGAQALLSLVSGPTIIYESQIQSTRGFAYHPVETIELLEHFKYHIYIQDLHTGALSPASSQTPASFENPDTTVIATKKEL
jgi:hypothetical protein